MFAIDDVFRKPNPCLKSVSVSLMVDGVLWRMVSTGLRRGEVDCRVSSVRRWLCPFSIWPWVNRSERVSIEIG